MKKILAIILSIIMVNSICCLNVSAVEESTEGRDKLFYLVDFLGVIYSFHGRTPAYYVDEAYPAYLEGKDLLQNKDATDEECLAVANEIVDAYINKLYLKPEYAKQTYELAKGKENYNNWYSEEDWSNFQNSLTELKTAIDTYEYECIELTVAFQNVLKIYNQMTNAHTLKGDVNGDGSVDVSDVTLLQKYLVGRAQLTDAQKMLSGADAYEDVAITDATNIQKYLTGETVPFAEIIFISDVKASHSYENVPDDLLMSQVLNFGICSRYLDRETIRQAPYENGETGLDELKVVYGYYDFCADNGYQP